MHWLRSCVRLTSLAAGVAWVTGAQALTINLVNSGGVEPGTSAYRGFSAAARFWESVLTDDVTLNLDVGFRSSGFTPDMLGFAESAFEIKETSAWRSALIADATTPLDEIAIANLPVIPSSTVYLNTALEKALGLYTGNPAVYDAKIVFNSQQAFDFDTRNGFQGLSSDFVAVAVHEMGHMLGFTSIVDETTTNDDMPDDADMFRYKNGAWDITWGGNPYFSIDGGATELFGRAKFSAGPDGRQTSHWKDGARNFSETACTQLLEAQIGIMDPTGGICQEGIVTGQDLALFDAIGWNLNQDILSNPGYAKTTSSILADYLGTSMVPEPATWAAMLGGFGLVGASMRRRRVHVRFG